MVALMGDYTKIKTGKLDANASSDDGLYPFFTCSKDSLKINCFSYDCECVLVAGNGDLNVKYYSGKFDAYQRTYIIESADKNLLNTKYLFFFLEKYVEKLREQAIGGVIKYIKLGYLTDAPLELPPLSEQLSKVTVLERVNNLVDKQKQQVALLDTLVKGRFVEMFGDPVENPMGWATAKLDEVFSIIDGDRGSCYPKQSDFSNKGYCLFLNTGNVTKQGFNFHNVQFISEAKDNELRKGRLQRYDLVLTTRGTVGNLAYFDDSIPFERMRINSGMVILRRQGSIIAEYFLELFGRPSVYSRLMSGTAQPQLPISSMRMADIPLPPLSLQNQFADFVREVDKSKVAVQQALKKLELLKDSLMQEYFG